MDSLTGYIDAKLELIKFDVKTDLSKGIVNLTFGIIILALVSIIFFLLSFGAAEYLNHRYDSIYIGYIILSSIYLFLLILLLLLRKYTNLTDRLIQYVVKFLDINEE